MAFWGHQCPSQQQQEVTRPKARLKTTSPMKNEVCEGAISCPHILGWKQTTVNNILSKMKWRIEQNKRSQRGRGCGSIRRIVPSEISKILYGTFTSSQQYRKDETKEKEAGNGPFYKKRSQRRKGQWNIKTFKVLWAANETDLNIIISWAKLLNEVVAVVVNGRWSWHYF